MITIYNCENPFKKYKIINEKNLNLINEYDELYNLIIQRDEAIEKLGKRSITSTYKRLHSNDKIKLEQLKMEIYKIQNNCSQSFSLDFEDEHSTSYTCKLCGASKMER